MGVYGKGEDCKFLGPTATSGTTPVVGLPLNLMQDYDVVGLQLIVDPTLDEFTVEDTDHVVAGTGVWTFANGAFTADMVGGTLTVAGATNAGNNGTFTILSRTSTTVTTATTGLVDETFDPDAVTAFVTFPFMEGEWLIEISNDVTPDGMAGSYDQDSGVEGHWTDITEAFSPAIEAVDTADDTTYSQYVQATICVRSMRITFTPTTGFGSPTVLGLARSYS